MGGVTDFITSCREIGVVSYWYSGLLGRFYSFGSDDDQFTSDHQEHFLQSYARRNGVTVSGEHPRLNIDPAVMEAVFSLRKRWNLEGHPLILIHPGPSYPVKHWPRESWVALVEKIKTATGGVVAQLGARVGSYANAATDDFQALPGAVCLVNQLSLPETIALIAQADLFVGLDSGLLHIAASTRAPAVGLWGPTSATFLFLASESKFFVTSGVDCQGCHHRVPRLHWFTGCPYDIKCMKDIRPDNVLRVCLEVLASVKK
jgi:ADP-heptose:LPS heptosyltransferase